MSQIHRDVSVQQALDCFLIECNMSRVGRHWLYRVKISPISDEIPILNIFSVN